MFSLKIKWETNSTIAHFFLDSSLNCEMNCAQPSQHVQYRMLEPDLVDAIAVYPLDTCFLLMLDFQFQSTEQIRAAYFLIQ